MTEDEVRLVELNQKYQEIEQRRDTLREAEDRLFELPSSRGSALTHEEEHELARIGIMLELIDEELDAVDIQIVEIERRTGLGTGNHRRDH